MKIITTEIKNFYFGTLVGEHPLKTPNKLAGPVGKEEVLGGVNRWRNTGKNTKNIVKPDTK